MLSENTFRNTERPQGEGVLIAITLRRRLIAQLGFLVTLFLGILPIAKYWTRMKIMLARPYEYPGSPEIGFRFA
jgi:hypothetical protein